MVRSATRRTAFAIDCDGDVACTFSVVEGEVVVSPEVGEPVTLTAGQSLTVTAGEEPPAPSEPGVEVLSGESFIAENLELDEVKAAGGQGDTGGDTGDEQGAGIDLAELEGEWTATPGNPRLGEVSGIFSSITPQLSVVGDRVAYSYATEETTPMGSPLRSGSGDIPMTAGTLDIGCDEDDCMGIVSGGAPLVIVADGSELRLATLEGGPREPFCGLSVPPGTWVLEQVDDDTWRYTAETGTGSGGGGCENSFSILYEVTLTRGTSNGRTESEPSATVPGALEMSPGFS